MVPLIALVVSFPVKQSIFKDIKMHESLAEIRLSTKRYTGQSPTTKLSTTKFVRKNNPCLLQQRQALVLRRQNVTPPERTGNKTTGMKSSGRKNVDTKKLKVCV